MNGNFDTAVEIQQFMLSRGWDFCFIGGLAVIRWGEVRLTEDVDLCLLTGFGGEEAFIDELLKHYESRVANAVEFAVHNRILLLKSQSGTQIDVSLGGLPFEAQMTQRGTEFKFADEYTLKTCSAEDLIVMKAFADRPKDWIDVQGILIRHGGALDLQLIRENLSPLCELKEAPEIVQRFEKMVEESQTAWLMKSEGGPGC
ncbi:MAG: nucleotidyl transferase AbiEii/AbiGii toxin family protein [Planctomycetota bacterium]|nr:nucleotidyl transferase AbiEii/AbiGii toxin family protein [Planctomycetota bacterium]MDA1137261.1 nucleotidyl transferase AbiEii/AbiGii toxin family protein [Planctomycetota bacterium]